MSQHFQSAGEIVLQVTLKYLENENCTAPKQEQEGDESNNYSMLYDLVAIQSSEGLQSYHPKEKKKTTDLLSCSRKAIPPKSATTILVIHKIRRFQLLVNVCMHSRYTHLLFACKMLWQTRMEGRHSQARTNMCPRNQADAHILRDGKDSNNNFKHYSFSVPCSVGALSPLESFLCFGFDRAMLSFFPRNICLFLATAAARCSSSIKSTYASP